MDVGNEIKNLCNKKGSKCSLLEVKNLLFYSAVNPIELVSISTST